MLIREITKLSVLQESSGTPKELFAEFQKLKNSGVDKTTAIETLKKEGWFTKDLEIAADSVYFDRNTSNAPAPPSTKTSITKQPDVSRRGFLGKSLAAAAGAAGIVGGLAQLKKADDQVASKTIKQDVLPSQKTTSVSSNSSEKNSSAQSQPRQSEQPTIRPERRIKSTSRYPKTKDGEMIEVTESDVNTYYIMKDFGTGAWFKYSEDGKFRSSTVAVRGKDLFSTEMLISMDEEAVVWNAEPRNIEWQKIKQGSIAYRLYDAIASLPLSEGMFIATKGGYSIYSDLFKAASK